MKVTVTYLIDGKSVHSFSSDYSWVSDNMARGICKENRNPVERGMREDYCLDTGEIITAYKIIPDYILRWYCPETAPI